RRAWRNRTASAWSIRRRLGGLRASGGRRPRPLQRLPEHGFADSRSGVMEHVNKFVNDGLSALMGALDNVIVKLTGSGGLSSAFGSVFGAGGPSIPTGGAPGGVPGGIPSGGGGGGGAAGAAGGLMNTINTVANVGSLISGVIGNFQNAR